MSSAWVASIILFSAIFGARSDDAAEKMIQIVANLDSYLISHNETELDLPNIGILPLDPIKLRNGHLGNFSTIELHGKPTVEKIKNRDGSRTYKFETLLGLKEMGIKYDFSANFLIYQREGTFTLATKKNEIEATGIVVIQPDKSCDATLFSVKYLKYEDNEIIVQPATFPFLGLFSEVLLDYITPLMVPIINKVLEGTLFFPSFQKHFSDLVCQNLTP